MHHQPRHAQQPHAGHGQGEHRQGADHPGGGGYQVWTWDKIRNEVRHSSDYLSLVIYGAQGSRTTSSSTSTMLIVYFDDADIVTEYRMQSIRF